MEVQYFGWSGVTIRHGETVIGFDLFGESVTWDVLPDAARQGAGTTILCVTHGHPEHCGSLRRFLSAGGARLDRTHVVSSQPVIDHVTRDLNHAINAHVLTCDTSVVIDGVQVSGFEWKHMPLLPQSVRAKASYAAHVLSRPIEFARVAFSGLRLPMSAPMLGFHVVFADGLRVLNYAEGLHRLTDPREVEAVVQRWPADVLLFAVEPDDVDAIPRWIEILSPSTVLLYEAHRPWREMFRLPYVDLEDYAADLSARFRHIGFSALTITGDMR
ncbi:MAG: hypothetical protein KA765_01285 [Thermoflexales bacterium]|nr:hypothetical protein [Thermoflexales bacterium]